MPELNALSNRVIGLAIDVHRAVGPGLLESVYQECMCMELADAAILSGVRLGLLMNFHAPRLKGGLKRFIV